MASLVHGVGINDADYILKPYAIKGDKRKYCPIYAKWTAMLQRCYSKYGEIKNPSYQDNFVNQRWLVFSSYRSWYIENYKEGLHLDKDILVKGNKEYGPDFCCFVPRKVNNALCIPKTKTSEFPLGVYLEKDSGRYKAQINKDGKYTNLGRYKTPEEAHKVWQWARAEQLEKIISWYATQECFRTDVAEALTSRVWQLRLEFSQGIETKDL